MVLLVFFWKMPKNGEIKPICFENAPKKTKHCPSYFNGSKVLNHALMNSVYFTEDFLIWKSMILPIRWIREKNTITPCLIPIHENANHTIPHTMICSSRKLWTISQEIELITQKRKNWLFHKIRVPTTSAPPPTRWNWVIFNNYLFKLQNILLLFQGRNNINLKFIN